MAEPLSRSRQNQKTSNWRLPALGTATAATAAVATTAATATVAAATAAATTTTATATTEGWAFFTWTSFVHGKRAALERLAIEVTDSVVHAGLVCHRDESEATWASGFAVHNEAHFGDCAVGAEKFMKIALSDVEGQIAHIHFGIHISDLLTDLLLLLRLFPIVGFQITK